MKASATTTLKLPPRLKARIARLAKKTGKSAHAFMVEAIEQQTTREEKYEEFVAAAIEADRAIDAGGEVYAAADVHAWMSRLAGGGRVARPKPWRG